MLYPVIMRTIQSGEYDAEVLQEKVDGWFAIGRLTAEQYEILTSMLVDAAEREEQKEEESEM